MNKKKLVKVIITLAFLGATGIFYSCNHGSEDTAVVFDTKKKAIEATTPAEEIAQTAVPGAEKVEEMPEEAADLYAYLCGAIKNPDVYVFHEGDRVIDLVRKAGGFTDEAATEALNLARELKDGEQIYVPTKEEASNDSLSIKNDSAGNTVEEKTSDSKVNINTATLEELTSLPGIGQAKASSIIKYRENNGAFSSIEDIMKIEGIKAGVFNKIQDYILVE